MWLSTLILKHSLDMLLEDYCAVQYPPSTRIIILINSNLRNYRRSNVFA